jgi:hypothetical protein
VADADADPVALGDPVGAAAGVAFAPQPATNAIAVNAAIDLINIRCRSSGGGR